jgi:hypothetical protein
LRQQHPQRAVAPEVELVPLEVGREQEQGAMVPEVPLSEFGQFHKAPVVMHRVMV